MTESQFLKLFQRIADGNAENRVETYENAYGMGVTIAVKQPNQATEIVQLMEHLQDSATAVAMADYMLTLRDKSNVNPFDVPNIAPALRDLNTANQGAPYGTAFMVGLQVGIGNKNLGRQTVKAFERSPRKEMLRLADAIIEIVRRSRMELGLQ